VKKLLLILLLSTGCLLAAGKDYEVSFHQPQNDIYQLDFNLNYYTMGSETRQGITYSVLHFSSSVYTEKKGFARLPYIAAGVQLPARKNMTISFTVLDYEDVRLNDPLLPSRGVIYRNENPADIPYAIDPASLTDSWYPGTAAKQTRPFIVKDIRGTSVYFYPFQYNGQKQILRIYKRIQVKLTENDEAPENPLTKEPTTILHEMDGIYRSLFINHISSSANLSVGKHGDILVITTARDQDAIAPYIQWKREKGFKVSEEVVASGTHVKDLIQQKYDDNNNLLYVQLVGDYDDVKSELGTSSNLPMDPDMGCVAGDDDFQDICIGRISANSADQVTVQVNKIIDYEKNPGSGDWYKTATGIASDQGPGDDNEKDYEHEDVIWNDKLDPFTFDFYNSIYDPSASKSDVTTAVNNGTGLINYTGHGSSTSWGTTGFSNSDVNNLSNGNLLPWIISVACNNGEFNMSGGDCYAEAWLKKESGGAVMFLGSTISQPWDPPMRGQDYFMDVLIGGYNYDDHEGQNGINTHEQRTIIGPIIVNGFDLDLSESNTTDDQNTVKTWTTFGDPAMQVRTKSPEAVTLSNETVTAGTAFSTTVTSNGAAVPDAMVTLSQDGQYFSGITDENGDVTINQTLSVGTALLVVTAFNKQTVYENVTVNSGNGPWIEVDSYSIDDSQNGNNNSQAEFDESFALNVSAKNSGNADAFGVDATLSSTDTYLDITTDSHSYGEIDAGQTVSGNDAFALTTVNNAPDQHQALCSVHFTDSESGSWTSNITITINAPAFGIGTLTVDDSNGGNDNGRLDAGETADFLIPTSNTGHAPAAACVGSLSTDNSYLTVNQPTEDLGTLNAGDTVNARFDVSASASTPAGTQAQVYYTVASGAYSATDTFVVNIGDLPSFNMSDTTVYSNNCLFYDSGGPDNPYDNREQLTMTFYPAQRSPAVRVKFTEFNLSDLDKLSVYDGPDKNAPEVDGSPFSGTALPPEIAATNAEGALTFYFQSNLLYTAAGWKAEISASDVSHTRRASVKQPEKFALFNNYPNPFNPSTTIRYQLSKSNTVRLTIFNTSGKKVRTLLNTRQQAGLHQLMWDGRDDNGNKVASGIFFCRMQAGSFNGLQKMILLK